MSKEIFPKWWPDHPPIYDIEKSYLANFEKGPFFSGKIPKRKIPLREKWVDFLGFKVATPLGVPAGPLLNARWVGFAAQMGFDIVTYKTIRSQKHPAHPLPNMIYVDTKGFLNYARAQETLVRASFSPKDMETLAATNSFGIPSQSKEILLKDIADAHQALQEGQVMIVSIVGTPREGEDFIQDFAITAQLAQEAGAKIIEVDLSCPNVATCEGNLFTDPKMVFAICSCIKKAVSSVPLIIKVGVIEDAYLLKQVMLAAAKAGVEGVCGINTMSMKVVDASGQAALGKKRLKAGVCGSPIRKIACDFVQKAHTINVQEKLDLKLLATGGVTEPAHFDHFFDLGADVAMSAVGMMWDPYLAARYTHRV